MAVSMNKDTTSVAGVIGLQKDVTVTGASSSAWIYFPYGFKMSCIVKSTGTAKVQITNDTIENIQAGTVDVDSIIDWDDGATASAQSIIEVCSAFRLTGISGTSKLCAYAVK